MNSSFVVIGLPESGKTTFLAALWHLIETGDTECSLTLDGYRGELTYLNKIAEAWRTFQKVPRTPLGGEVNISIDLHNQKTGLRGTAFFPDVAGEVFDRQVIERRCRAEFVEVISADDGILFFISANTKDDFVSIGEMNERLGIATERQVNGANQEGEQTALQIAHGRDWQQEDLPRQVKIVQVLSDLLRRPFEQRRRRIAILISAWDLARSMELTPQQWLASHMPLVDQFMKANKTAFEYEIYGVSAQGVNLENAEAVDEIAKLTQPSRRIQIIGPEGDGHDLTTPLVWLMSAQE